MLPFLNQISCGSFERTFKAIMPSEETQDSPLTKDAQVEDQIMSAALPSIEESSSLLTVRTSKEPKLIEGVSASTKAEDFSQISQTKATDPDLDTVSLGPNYIQIEQVKSDVINENQPKNEEHSVNESGLSLSKLKSECFEVKSRYNVYRPTRAPKSSGFFSRWFCG